MRRKAEPRRGDRKLSDVPFVIFDPMPVQKRDQLLYEAHALVMLRLLLDVPQNARQCGTRNGESGVLILPFEGSERRFRIADPAR